MPVALKSSGGGSVTLDTPVTASTFTLTVPALTATVITDSSGVLNIGSGQIYKDASGNLGIGTSSPTQKLQVYSSAGSGGQIQVTNSATGATLTDGVLFGYDGSNDVIINNQEATSLKLYTSGSERARIDSSGNLLVGATTAFSSSKVLISCSMNAFNGLVMRDTGTVGGNYVQFVNDTPAQAGAITHNGSTTVLYTTSSDYRLKDTIEPMKNALDRVSLLNPVTFKWKSDGSNGEGFIAHELQSVIPGAVCGEKDAVDSDGNPKHQGVDASFVVATLVAAIQELKADLDAAKAEIAALKGNT